MAPLTVFALLDWSDLNKQCDSHESDEILASETIHQLLLIAPSNSSSCQRMNLSPSVQSQMWITQYSSHFVHHWSQVNSISDEPLPEFAGVHPCPNPMLSLPEWKLASGSNVVYFAGTEHDLYSPGSMEGAVGSAHCVITDLMESFL